MKLEITPENIDSLVKDAVLKSAFGQTIEKAVNSALTGYDNPVEKQMKIFVGQLCYEVIREKFSDKIRSLVTEAVEKSLTDVAMQSVTEKIVEQMMKNIDRY